MKRTLKQSSILGLTIEISNVQLFIFNNSHFFDPLFLLYRVYNPVHILYLDSILYDIAAVFLMNLFLVIIWVYTFEQPLVHFVLLCFDDQLAQIYLECIFVISRIPRVVLFVRWMLFGDVRFWRNHILPNKGQKVRLVFAQQNFLNEVNALHHFQKLCDL